MKIFVTGGTGFIGNAFCVAALDRGHEILALCRNPGEGLDARCKFAVGSMESIPWSEIEKFHPEAAMHLAWAFNPGTWMHAAGPDPFVQLSVNLFEGLAERGVQRLAGTGSCAEYAADAEVLSEGSTPIIPGTSYARGKVDTCNALQSLAEARNVFWRWYRIFYCYGENDHPQRLVPSLMSQLASGSPVNLRTPDSVKDYLHVGDVASALCLGIESGTEGPLNVGSGAGIRIMDLAHAIARVVGADPSLVTGADPPALDPIPVRIADNSLLRSIGWWQEVPLREGLDRTWRAMRQ